jgi:hypothetical protein
LSTNLLGKVPATTAHATPNLNGRILGGVLAIRDVPDVERHVAACFASLDLPEAERRVAILGAIGDAHRIDRALAPERPLLPLLDAHLSARAARLRSRTGNRLNRVA